MEIQEIRKGNWLLCRKMFNWFEDPTMWRHLYMNVSQDMYWKQDHPYVSIGFVFFHEDLNWIMPVFRKLTDECQSDEAQNYLAYILAQYVQTGDIMILWTNLINHILSCDATLAEIYRNCDSGIFADQPFYPEKAGSNDH